MSVGGSTLQMLAGNKCLRELDISHNLLSAQQVDQLVAQIKYNLYLTCLRIDRCDCISVLLLLPWRRHGDV